MAQDFVPVKFSHRVWHMADGRSVVGVYWHQSLGRRDMCDIYLVPCFIQSHKRFEPLEVLEAQSWQ